ncbi:metalloregulator ArsR/SmtB family transcription factor (plasmid) [Priestia megaterium]|uniref:ArsR/SmtB family transcription factor n=1 Tax=Priestia megaterium TaxID=1404 RepID=UPI0035BE91F6
MENLLVFKSLSNETRNQILQWLKEPEKHFGVQCDLPSDTDFKNGVCVGDIQQKSGLAQSVISSYLNTMKNAGLLESKRIGQWTYYRRNEETIQQFKDYVLKNL